MLVEQPAPPPPTNLHGLPPDTQADIATREYMEMAAEAGRLHRMLDSLQQWVESLYEERGNADAH